MLWMIGIVLIIGLIKILYITITNGGEIIVCECLEKAAFVGYFLYLTNPP